MQQIAKLQDFLPINSELSNEISIYKGELTGPCLVNCVVTIKKAFPSLPIDFYDVFTDRLKANGFTDERLRDAVNYVVDTCIYPTPTIANFISFDRRFKVFNYEEMLSKLNEYGSDPKFWDSYKRINLPDREKPVWIHINDAKKYKL